MTIEYLSKRAGKVAIVAAMLAASVYLAMVSVTLAHLEVVSGQVPFDMRPFGYSPTEAATLLDAFGNGWSRILSNTPDTFGHALSSFSRADIEQHDLLVWKPHDKQKICAPRRYPLGRQCAVRLYRECWDRGDDSKLARRVGFHRPCHKRSDNLQIGHYNPGCDFGASHRVPLVAPGKSGRSRLNKQRPLCPQSGPRPGTAAHPTRGDEASGTEAPTPACPRNRASSASARRRPSGSPAGRGTRSPAPPRRWRPARPPHGRDARRRSCG